MFHAATLAISSHATTEGIDNDRSVSDDSAEYFERRILEICLRFEWQVD